MDIGTGRVYGSRDEALAAGLSPSDLLPVEHGADGVYRLSSDETVRVLGGTKNQPHQGKREMARRAKRLASVPAQG